MTILRKTSVLNFLINNHSSCVYITEFFMLRKYTLEYKKAHIYTYTHMHTHREDIIVNMAKC